MKLHEAFPEAHFSAAASEAGIQAAEAQLGFALPQQLRKLYAECDGFRENRGNAKYFLSLTDDDVIGSLVTTTRFWHTEWKQYYPSLDFSGFVFFGFSSGDEVWGLSLSGSPKVIAYHHGMEEEYETIGTDILSVYQENFEEYLHL